MLSDESGKPESQPLNSWYRTPNMERLADQGIRFSDFYPHNTCSPSRISLMTGQNSARHRTAFWIDPEKNNREKYGPTEWNWTGLTKRDVTLPRVLQKCGYQTIHIGKGHFGPFKSDGENPLNLGFDVNIGGSAHGMPGSYFGIKKYGGRVPGLEKYYSSDTFLTEALTLEANTAIDSSLEQKKPFYLYLSHFAVHSPLESDPRFEKKYANSNKEKNAQAYATLVEGMDKSLGDLIDHLKVKGIAENTLIFFLGDNGSDAPLGGMDAIASSSPFRGMKGSKWEGGVRVPFIAAWAKPDVNNPFQQRLPIKAGAIQKQSGAIYDIFPTITELVQAPVPEGHVVDGHSLKPLLEGGSDSLRSDEFLSHFPHERGTAKYFTAFRKGEWKVIYSYNVGKTSPKNPYELYNLKEDRSESKNLANAEPEQLKRMMSLMVKELETMGALYPEVEGQVIKPVIP